MTRALLKSTSVVGGMTLVSRILGLARDVLFARWIGAGIVMDAFLVAFKIPNFLRRLFAEGAFSQAFVPVLADYKTNREGEVNELVDRVAGMLSGALFLVTLAGVLAAPLVVMVFAPGFYFTGDGESFALASEMLRWTFPYILFISLTAFAGGILNTWGRFGVPAFTPVLLNLSLIGAAAWLAPKMPNPGLGLAIGVFVAGIAQLLFQLPFLKRIGILPRPRSPFVKESRRKGAAPTREGAAPTVSSRHEGAAPTDGSRREGGDPTASSRREGAAPTGRSLHDGVRRILRLMGPAIFGSSVAQVNLLLDTLIASFLFAGSISWLYYSDRLMEFPLGVFGIALATVILPGLSKQHAEESPREFSATLDWALRWVCVIAVPAAVGLFVLAGPAIATLFQYREFTAADTAMARLSLMAYAFGLLGFTLVKVLVTGYFSRQDTRTPVRFGVIALVSNMVLNIALVVPWVMAGATGPHAGLALATSIAAFINAALLYRGLRRAGVLTLAPGWGALFARTGVAVLAMAAVVIWYAGPLDAWFELGAWARAGQLAVAIGLGAAVYAAVLWGSGLRPRDLKVSV